MQLHYFAAFALAFFISFLATFLVSRIAVRRKILDLPDSERRFHKYAVPTLGGIAIFSSFFLVTLFLGVFGGYLLNGNIPFGILLAI
jgi:UDP-GlcNAc:undecaprenyl-phosphate GlcNAc-1-phosphate transferase